MADVQAKTTLLSWAALSTACGAMFVLGPACSGSVAIEPGHGSTIYILDSGSGGSGGSSGGSGGSSSGSSQIDSSVPVDGTSGKACSSDTDCTGVGGPGINVCSSDYVTQVAGVTGASLPNSVCLVPATQTGANCDPTSATDPNGFYAHFCDGPDDPSSPGLCVPIDPQNPTPGMGVCLPKCSFKTDGTAPVGCTAPNTCTFSIFAPGGGTALTVIGYGYCQGTCQKDSDCTAPGLGYCQTDVGLCTAPPGVARTKAIGATCNGNDYLSGACNCDYNPGTGVGFCTSACVVGGVPCPAGFVCDDGELNAATFSTTIPLTAPTPGLAGLCLPACSGSSAGGAADAAVDGAADAAVDGAGGADGGTGPAAGGCPGGSTCFAGTFVGPDCQP